MTGLKAKLERDFGRSTIRVWLYRPNPNGKTTLYRIASSDEWIVEELEPTSGLPEPSLTIDEDALSVLVAEGMNLLPPDQAQARHLDDAIKTRDRLLSMAEGAAEAEREADGVPR